jgi:hypothetical protein
VTLEALLSELRVSRGENDQLVKLLQEIASLESDRHTNLPKLKTRLAKIETMTSQSQSRVPVGVTTWLDQYKQELAHSEEQSRRRFGVDLAKELQPLGLALEGQYPVLKAGLFTLKLDLERDRLTIWYGPEQERLDECRLLADEAKKRVEQAMRTLGANLEIDQFMAKLRVAYRRTPGSEKGEPVPIIAVLPEMAFQLQSADFLLNPLRENYRSYSRADFSYDLYRHRRSAIQQGLRLSVAARTFTRRRQDLLWIPDDDRGHGTPYSHLHFEETTS